MEEDKNQEPENKNKSFKQIYADWLLGIVSFAESAFLPIITDPFLLAMTIAKPKLWVRYTVIAGVASVLGGLLGYFLGVAFFDLWGEQIIAFYGVEDMYEKVVVSLGENAFVFTLIGAFTPVPYKLVAIVGGAMHINIFAFIAASIIGRFVRFGLVAYISAKFGEYAVTKFNKRFKLVTIALVGGIVLYLAMILF